MRDSSPGSSTSPPARGDVARRPRGRARGVTAAGRSATSLAPLLPLLAVPVLAAADHGAPAARPSGLGWETWLLMAGALVAAVLAAWAFFGPDRPEDPPEDARPTGRETP